MDAGIITAIVGAFTALGAGLWKLIDRADKKRERREIKVEELLKSRVASLEAQNEAEKTARATEVNSLRRYSSRVKAAAGKWREQLIAAGIDPEPAEWPAEEEQTHE